MRSTPARSRRAPRPAPLPRTGRRSRAGGSASAAAPARTGRARPPGRRRARLSTETGTAQPPRWARPRPVAATTREAISSWTPSPRSSRSAPASTARAATAPADGTTKRPSTRADAAPERTAPVSARPPRSSPSPVTTIVLPAPVSPVSTLRPGPSSTTAWLITPRSVILISSSTASSRELSRVDGAAPPGDGQLELGDEAVGERAGVEPGEPERLAPAADLDPRTGWQLEGAPAVAPEHTGAGPVERPRPRAPTWGRRPAGGRTARGR